jgi:hypothetical protein
MIEKPATRPPVEKIEKHKATVILVKWFCAQLEMKTKIMKENFLSWSFKPMGVLANRMVKSLNRKI